MNIDVQSFFLQNLIEDFFNKYNIIKDNCKVIVCWSGGKDATTLLSLMAEYKKKVRNFPLTALMVPYPKTIVRKEHQEETIKYWENLGVQVEILDHNYPDPGTFPKQEICPKCKEIRRNVLVEQYFQYCDLSKTIIATGHTSWDLAAYIIELTISRLASGSASSEIGSYERYLEVMNKFLPVFHFKNGPTLIRPLLRLGDDDVFRVILEKRIPFPFSFIPDPCPWRKQRKRVFQNYFQEIELKFDIENLNKYVREVFKIPKSEEYHKLPYYSFLF